MVNYNQSMNANFNVLKLGFSAHVTFIDVEYSHRESTNNMFNDVNF